MPDLEKTSSLLDSFLTCYSNRVTESIRLYKEVGEKVVLCVEEVGDTIRPDMAIVGKTYPQLMQELDPHSHSVKYMEHQLKTYDPEREGMFVLQFSRSVVESVVVQSPEHCCDTSSDED